MNLNLNLNFDLGGNRTHDLRIRSTVTLPTELRGRTEEVGDDLGGESRRRESMGSVNLSANKPMNIVPDIFVLL